MLLVFGALGVGGLLVASERRDRSETDEGGSVPSVDIPTSPPSGSGTEAPTATLGSVAPPVSVADDLIGDLADEADLPEFTPVDPPTRPDQFSPVPTKALATGRIDGDLPDGSYIAYVAAALDDDGEYISWHVGSPAGPTYPSFVTDMIFASVVIDARSSDHPGSAVITPSTLWQFVADGAPTVPVPESDDVAVVSGAFILTAVGGSVVAAEGIRES